MARATIVKPARLIRATPCNFTIHAPSGIMLKTCGLTLWFRRGRDALTAERLASDKS
jgi:hypothetical protein